MSWVRSAPGNRCSSVTARVDSALRGNQLSWSSLVTDQIWEASPPLAPTTTNQSTTATHLLHRPAGRGSGRGRAACAGCDGGGGGGTASARGAGSMSTTGSAGRCSADIAQQPLHRGEAAVHLAHRVGQFLELRRDLLLCRDGRLRQLLVLGLPATVEAGPEGAEHLPHHEPEQQARDDGGGDDQRLVHRTAFLPLCSHRRALASGQPRRAEPEHERYGFE